MSDLQKIIAENQKEFFKLVVPNTINFLDPQNVENSDSEEENTFVAPTTTPIKSKTTAQIKTSQVSRNTLVPLKPIFDTTV